MDILHRPLYTPDLLVNALNQDPGRPLLNILGGASLTVGDVRDATSQFCQAFQSLGLKRGSRIGLLSSNRPEVLLVANAIQITAAIYVPMHPLGGLHDHLHVVTDAAVDILIFDAEHYSERAAALAQQVPELQLLAFGESALAKDLGNL